MTAAIVIAPELRARIHRDLAAMARDYPRSLATNIKDACFAEVVDLIAERIDVSRDPDFEINLIVALARVKESASHLFHRRRSRADTFNDFWKNP